MRLLNLTLTAVLGVSMLSGCSDSEKDPAGDIRVTGCAADPTGGKPKAEGTIVNNTSKPSAYTLRVKFLDPAGNQVSEATTGVGKVDPGASAIWRLEGGVSARGPLTCQVVNPTRTAVGA